MKKLTLSILAMIIALALPAATQADGTCTPMYGGGYQCGDVTYTPQYGGGYTGSDGSRIDPQYGGGFRYTNPYTPSYARSGC